MAAILILFLLALCLLFAETTAKGDPCKRNKDQAVKDFIFRITPDTHSLSFGSLTAWSGGGGDQQTIPSASGGPFAGRKFGGGDRKTIYGSRQYGSGYPYGVTDNSTIAGRPFPYGVWPISFGSYLGGQEIIGPSVDTMRPGGPLVTVPIGSTDTQKWPGLTSAEVYTMIGDRDSILFMTADLANWCHATPQWPALFNASNPSVKPENVIQYYRASSFALAYSAYNNTFASSNPSTSLSLADSTPLPSNISNSAFLRCVNDTIGTAIPIVDAAPKPPKKLTPGAIAGIVVGCVVAAGILIWLNK